MVHGYDRRWWMDMIWMDMIGDGGWVGCGGWIPEETVDGTIEDGDR